MSEPERPAEVEPDESEELSVFRRQVRTFISENRPAAPGFKLPQSFLEVESQAQFDYLRDWQRKLYDGGYIGFDVPEEYGGRGVDRDRHRIVQQELVFARAPFLVNFIALTWVGPTILAYGTEAQKKRMLAALLRGDEIWCQGFSEPGAGSDLASLQTRAEKTADGWLVTGHKVWTTLAHQAKWMILLARTDPSVNKYQGLSYFLFPMDAPGVSVEPLIKMTGEGGFNQVLLDHAPMPKEALLGQEGQGWQIAMTTLLFERGAAEGSGRERGAQYVAAAKRLLELARQAERDGGRASEHPVLVDRVIELVIQAHALALSSARSAVPGLSSERAMALPFMSKLVASEFNQRLSELGCELLGADVGLVGSSRVDLQACKLEYSIVSPK